MSNILDYIKNNPQEIMFQAILSIVVLVLVAVAFSIWINQYRYRKHYGSGEKLFQSGDLDTAIRELKAAQILAKKTLSGKKRDMEKCSHLLAQVAMAAGRWEEAIAALTECVAISPENTDYRVSLAENYIRSDQQHKAREALDAALKLVSLAKVEELGKKRGHTIPRPRGDEGIERELGQLTRPLAVCQSEMLDKLEILKPDFDGRQFILEKLLEGEEDNVNLARFYVREHVLVKNGMAGYVKSEFDLETPSADVRSEEEDKGAKEEKDTDEAPETGQDVPGDAPSSSLEGSSVPQDMQKTESQYTEPPRAMLPKDGEESYLAKAKEALDELEIEPLLPEFYALSAFISEEDNDSVAAEENYERAISLNPQYAEAHFNLALLCADKFDDMERAIASLRSAIESNAEFAEAHHNLALLLLGTGDDNWQVKHHLNEAIRINARFADIYYNVALLLARKDYKAFLLG